MFEAELARLDAATPAEAAAIAKSILARARDYSTDTDPAVIDRLAKHGGPAAPWLALAAWTLRFPFNPDLKILLGGLLERALDSGERRVAVDIVSRPGPVEDAPFAPLLGLMTPAELDVLLPGLLDAVPTAAILARITAPLDERSLSVLEKLPDADLSRFEAALRNPDPTLRRRAAELHSAWRVRAGLEQTIPDAKPPGLEDFWPVKIRHRPTYGVAGVHVETASARPWCAACGSRNGRYTYLDSGAGTWGHSFSAEVECPDCGKYSLYDYQDSLSYSLPW